MQKEMKPFSVILFICSAPNISIFVIDLVVFFQTFTPSVLAQSVHSTDEYTANIRRIWLAIRARSAIYNYNVNTH